ncbi:MAG: hypothetical protein KF724_10055 [Phycisphaeraceae bacterium]|nr:hypothetical protein [Phycisphaeraceae bacterium]
MSHDKDHRSHHGHGGGHAPRRQGGRHGVKLFILNAVLFLACSAFAGMIMLDYLPSPIEMKVIAALIVVPLVMAVVATVVHVKADRWTSVDDMAERFTK